MNSSHTKYDERGVVTNNHILQHMEVGLAAILKSEEKEFSIRRDQIYGANTSILKDVISLHIPVFFTQSFTNSVSFNYK